MSRVKAISFRVEWDDGSVWTAEGDVAAAVMDWYRGGESMNCIHGAVYSGPQVSISAAPEEKKSTIRALPLSGAEEAKKED